MRGKFFLFLSIVIIIFYFSCSNTPYPESYYTVEMTDWIQVNVVGDTGEVVTCYIEVNNNTGFAIHGFVEVEATAFDGTKYKDDINFPYIAGSVTFQDDIDFKVDGKRVIDVKIIDEDFYYR